MYFMLFYLPISICLSINLSELCQATSIKQYSVNIVSLLRTMQSCQNPPHYSDFDSASDWLAAIVEIESQCSWWRHQMESFAALLALCAGVHRSPVNSQHKSQWRGALKFSLICAWINGWAKAGDLRRHRAHYDVTVVHAYKLTWIVAGFKDKTFVVTSRKSSSFFSFSAVAVIQDEYFILIPHQRNWWRRLQPTSSIITDAKSVDSNLDDFAW